jgi:hypothetical protein
VLCEGLVLGEVPSDVRAVFTEELDGVREVPGFDVAGACAAGERHEVAGAPGWGAGRSGPRGAVGSEFAEPLVHVLVLDEAVNESAEAVLDLGADLVDEGLGFLGVGAGGVDDAVEVGLLLRRLLRIGGI